MVSREIQKDVFVVRPLRSVVGRLFFSKWCNGDVFYNCIVNFKRFKTKEDLEVYYRGGKFINYCNRFVENAI